MTTKLRYLFLLSLASGTAYAQNQLFDMPHFDPTDAANYLGTTPGYASYGTATDSTNTWSSPFLGSSTTTSFTVD